jgi:hypothetical protein
MERVNWFVALVPGLAIAAAAPALELQSETFEARGTQQEILSRATVCVAKLVRFDPLRQITPSTSTPPGSFTLLETQGGPVFVTADIDSGTLVVNNRTQGGMQRGSRFYMDSTITLQSSDGKFQITHSSIRTLGWEPIETLPELVAPATEALVNQTRAIANCVTAPPAYLSGF